MTSAGAVLRLRGENGFAADASSAPASGGDRGCCFFEARDAFVRAAGCWGGSSCGWLAGGSLGNGAEYVLKRSTDSMNDEGSSTGAVAIDVKSRTSDWLSSVENLDVVMISPVCVSGLTRKTKTWNCGLA